MCITSSYNWLDPSLVSGYWHVYQLIICCTKRPTHTEHISTIQPSEAIMNVIYFLIPLAMLLLAFGIAAFLWAVRSGQFDDLDREAYRILFDEDEDKQPQEKSNSQEDQLR